MKGLKIRVQQSPASVAMCQAFGAAASPMSFGEVYTAIQQGVIDGAENNELALTSNKHGEVAKYFSYNKHQMIPDLLIGNLSFLNGLSKEERKVFYKAAELSNEEECKQWDVQVKEAKKVALEYLQSYKDNIKTALDNGTVILATGNSFEIFGQSVTDCDGIKHEGLSFFPYETVEGKERIVTDSLCTTLLCGGDIIGFVNKASLTTGATSPLFDVKQGSGNSKDDNKEGVHYGNFYGTHLIGPVLIRNPQLCEYFADMLIKKQ